MSNELEVQGYQMYKKYFCQMDEIHKSPLRFITLGRCYKVSLVSYTAYEDSIEIQLRKYLVVNFKLSKAFLLYL